MMFSALKIINSKNKRNIRFVAAGSYQIEFFQHEAAEYFTIYKFNHDSQGQSGYYLINLKAAVVTKISDTEFQFVQGSSTYKLRMIENITKNTIYVTRYLWGWLPLSKLGGIVSKSGLSTLKRNLEVHTNDLPV